VIAVPWLAAPGVILLAVSQVHPLFTGRYVEFSQPAVALLCAAGLSWMAGLAARVPQPLAHRLAWLPPVAIVALLGVLLAGPQQSVRRPDARIDNLRWASTILHWVFWYIGVPAVLLGALGAALLARRCLRGQAPGWTRACAQN